jgi:hypothetical protein
MTKLVKLVITEAQRDTIVNGLKVALEQYETSMQGESTDTSACTVLVLTYFRTQAEETRALLAELSPEPKPRLAKAKPQPRGKKLDRRRQH